MRKILAILLCKAISAIENKFNNASPKPGSIALKICPKILKKIVYPKTIIAITGSNGKTSTSEMINDVLVSTGKKVGFNSDQFNQTDGIVKLVLNNCNIFGKFNKDVLLFEIDERYTSEVFEYITPTYLLITNLYRDRLSSNGNPEYILNIIHQGIKPETILVLNGDDPLVTSIAKKFSNVKYFFGVNDNKYTTKKCDSLYDDGYYCPVCKNKMIYKYRQFAHIGNYACSACGFARSNVHYEVDDVNLQEGYITLGNNRIDLAFKSMFNVYNILAAYALCKIFYIEDKILCDYLSKYSIKHGIVRNFIAGTRPGTLLLAEHENSMSYNQNLKYVTNYDGDVSVLIIVDSINRKPYTSDTTWLWDINFELLNSKNVKTIVLAGRYNNELAQRFEYAHIDMKKVVVRKRIDIASYYLRFKGKGHIFVITCSSDRSKFMDEVKEV